MKNFYTIISIPELEALTGKFVIWTKRVSSWTFMDNSNLPDIEAGDLTLVVSVKKSATLRDTHILPFLHKGKTMTLNIRSSFLSDSVSFRAVNGTSILEGKRFVFSGTLENDRVFYQKLVKFFGGTVQNSVTKDTMFLVKPPSLRSTTKLKRAEDSSIKLLGEKELFDMING